MTWQISSDSSDATERIGAELGARLRGGEVIELLSDLGGGKTTLARGIARGAGSSDNVASPSFTISREYRAGDLTIHHYDFYRLGEGGLMNQELADVLDDPQAAVIVEWANIVDQVLPPDRVLIRIEVMDETRRRLHFSAPQRLAYIKGGPA